MARGGLSRPGGRPPTPQPKIRSRPHVVATRVAGLAAPRREGAEEGGVSDSAR
jgi:hypothetical protein